MGNSKVIFGNETLIDLTGDTVTPDTLLAGTTAHNRSGEQIVGTAAVPEELDDLTDVKLISPADGDLLQYDSTSGKWVNSAKIPQKVAGLQKTGCVNILPNDAISKVIDGVTFTKYADGRVAINGTNGSNSVIDYPIYSGKVAVDRNTPYYLSGCPAGGSISTYYFAASIYDGTTWKWWARETGNGLWFTPQTGDLISCTFQIQPGATLNNVILEPMVSYASDDYLPYSMTNRELTEAVSTKKYSLTFEAGYSSDNGDIRVINGICYFTPNIYNTQGDMTPNTLTKVATLPNELKPAASVVRVPSYSASTGTLLGVFEIQRTGDVKYYAVTNSRYFGYITTSYPTIYI